MPVLLTTMTHAVTTITTTIAAPATSSNPPPKAADQKPDNISELKASIPLIIFATATVGGVALLILFGIMLRKCLKKRKEAKYDKKHQQEGSEVWLARQNLEREERRVERMAFGGWFGRMDFGNGVEGRDFAVEARNADGGAGEMEMGRLKKREEGT